MIDELLELLEAKKELEKSKGKSPNYDWAYFHHREIARFDDAKEAFDAALNALIDKRIQEKS